MSQYSVPGQEFGQPAVITTQGRRHMVLEYPNDQHKSSHQSTSSSASVPLVFSTPSSQSSAKPTINNTNIFEDDFSPLDIHGNLRKTIQGIEITHNSTPTSSTYSLIYTFPALLAPSLLQKIILELPQPTTGGSIELLLTQSTLEALLTQFQTIYTTIQQARRAQPFTHYFGIPLGPLNLLCYDLTEKSEKKTITRAHHFTQEENKSDIRFSGSKMMVSETSWLLARNVSAMFNHIGIDTTRLLDTVPHQHDNYKAFETVDMNQVDTESEYDPKSASEIELLSKSIMPLPKLHMTLFCVRIFSRDEFNLLTKHLQSIQKVLYDAIGATSINLVIKKCLGWALTKNNPNQNTSFPSKQRCKHFVASLAESGKDGKLSSKDHIPTIAPVGSPYHDPDLDQERSSLELPQQQLCPRIALLVGILAHQLRKIGLLTMTDIRKDRLGSETGQYCTVNWHMTLLNSKYAQKLGYTLPLDPIEKASRTVRDWGTHRIPCINLYRMGSKLNFNPAYPIDSHFANLSQWLPARHKIKDHYTIDYTIPMP